MRLCDVAKSRQNLGRLCPRMVVISVSLPDAFWLHYVERLDASSTAIVLKEQPQGHGFRSSWRRPRRHVSSMPSARDRRVLRGDAFGRCRDDSSRHSRLPGLSCGTEVEPEASPVSHLGGTRGRGGQWGDFSGRVLLERFCQDKVDLLKSGSSRTSRSGPFP